MHTTRFGKDLAEAKDLQAGLIAPTQTTKGGKGKPSTRRRQLRQLRRPTRHLPVHPEEPASPGPRASSRTGRAATSGTRSRLGRTRKATSSRTRAATSSRTPRTTCRTMVRALRQSVSEMPRAHLNRDQIESNLGVPGIQGHQENTLYESFKTLRALNFITCIRKNYKQKKSILNSCLLYKIICTTVVASQT